MTKPPLFVELCAGTAALSLRLASRHARPPVSRMGAKTGYANAILRAMGLRAGLGADAYLWCEPDPGCRLLLHAYTDRALALAAAEIIRGWKDEDPRALWERLRAEGPARCPPVEAREVGRMAFLWRGSFSQKGPDAGIGSPEGKEPSETFGGFRPLVEELPPLLERLPTLPATILTDARPIEPAALPPGTVAFIDPPYVGTTGYAADLPRDEVCTLAERWASAGALVVISEAEPIGALGWHHVEITGERVGQKRTFSKQQREWLTMSRAPGWTPAVQVSMWGAA